MATTASGLLSRLADADFRKLGRWIADRFRHARHAISWHASRVWMQAYAASRLSPKLPPGSLSASCPFEARSDDRFYLKQLHRYGPIFKLFWGSGNLKICVVGYARARSLFNRQRDVLHPVSTDVTSLLPAEYLRSMSPDIHPHYRRLFKNALRDDLIAAWEPELRGIIRRELSALAAAAAAATDSPPAERVYTGLNRVTTRTLLLLVLGVRPDADIVPLLEDLYQRLGPNGCIAEVGPEQAAAFPAIRAIVLQILHSLSHDNTGGFGDSVLARVVQTSPASISDDTVIGNAIYMVERGRHDLRDLLRWIFKYLSDNPSITAELRAGLAEPGSNTQLAEACVLETLRMDQAEALHRKVLQPFILEGYRVPKGSWISILMRENHRDPETFDEPDCFRPHRFLTRTYTADEYAPFGLGEHQCIGNSLVRRVGTMFVEELVAGFTWSVTRDGPRQYGNFHWTPSPSFAIDIRPSR